MLPRILIPVKVLRMEKGGETAGHPWANLAIFKSKCRLGINIVVVSRKKRTVERFTSACVSTSFPLYPLVQNGAHELTFVETMDKMKFIKTCEKGHFLLLRTQRQEISKTEV